MVYPARLHQEDFAQAMGIASFYKYEPKGCAYLAGMSEILRQWSENPLEDQLKLWNMLVFNFLIGNTDSHLKNASLLYNRDLLGLRLAPAYDIISTTAYESGTRRLSIRIGEAETLDEVNIDAFRNAAQEIRLSEKMAVKCLDSMANQFETALKETAKELTDAGFSAADKIKEHILQTGGYRNIQ